MKENILHLNIERIKRNLKTFEKTGYIHGSLLSSSLNSAGQDYAILIYKLKTEIEIRRNRYIQSEKDNLIKEKYKINKELLTNNSKFKYPTILSKYKKDMNPVLAIHQEYQYAKSSKKKNKFTIWIINLIEEMYDEIIYALEKDIERIHVILYNMNNNICCVQSSQLQHLLHRLNTAYQDLIICNQS